MDEDHRYLIRVTLEDMDVIRNVPLDTGCMPIRRREDGTIELEALASDDALAKLRRLRRRGIRVEVVSDLADDGRDVGRLVSQVNRYDDGSLPEGLGIRRD